MKSYEALLKSGLEGLIDVVTNSRPTTLLDADLAIGLSAGQRSFTQQAEQIRFECVRRLIRLSLSVVEQPTLRLLYDNREALKAACARIEHLVTHHIEPRLRTIDRCGDLFSRWMELKRTTKEFGQQYEEMAEQLGAFGFEDGFAVVAILALLIQAQSDKKAGNKAAAWSCLAKASYWLGVCDGGHIGFHTGSRYGWSSSAKVRARKNADRRHQGNARLRALAIELLHSRRPPAGWPTMGAASAELRPALQAECDRINEELLQLGRKRIALVSDRTIQNWFRSLDECEKVELFASKRRGS